MTLLTTGANASLPAGDLAVLIRHGTIADAEIDVSAFLLATTGKVRSDADLCFYGQPSVADGAVALETSAAGEARFTVAPHRIPPGVEKVVFTATIHENRAPFSRIAGISLEVGGVRGQIACTGMTETALILAELYQRNGVWKVRVVGQGFNGGLGALATHLGVDIAGSTPPASPPPPPSHPGSAPLKAPVDPPPPPAPRKVVLDKPGQSHKVSLAKGVAGELIVVRAQWSDNGDGNDDNDDLDLRIGLLLPSGVMRMIHADDLGSLQHPPLLAAARRRANLAVRARF